MVGGQLTGSPCQVALANPTGLYIQAPDLSAFQFAFGPEPAVRGHGSGLLADCPWLQDTHRSGDRVAVWPDCRTGGQGGQIFNPSTPCFKFRPRGCKQV